MSDVPSISGRRAMRMLLAVPVSFLPRPFPSLHPIFCIMRYANVDVSARHTTATPGGTKNVRAARAHRASGQSSPLRHVRLRVSPPAATVADIVFVDSLGSLPRSTSGHSRCREVPGCGSCATRQSFR